MMATRWLRHLCEGFLALCLLVMVVAVFGNVVLRYVWGTGWVVTEELARLLFIWLGYHVIASDASRSVHANQQVETPAS